MGALFWVAKGMRLCLQVQLLNMWIIWGCWRNEHISSSPVT